MERIGKYQIVEQIGAGGFSEVWKGFDPHIKRHVAIKTCAAQDSELRSRFFQEGEIAGNLQHKNIVTVFDFGFEGEMPYLVQEYLAGEDLDKKIKRGDVIPLDLKVEILRQVALGLQHAHEQGIVHRDIKPGNVRVLEDGTAKIMDFGIAKILQQDTGLTKTGMTVGTAAYLAPEQIRGRSADPRTDVFSFGVLAYELLTLNRPFAGEQISAVLYQILNEEPKQLVTEVANCPEKLTGLIMRCLNKETDDRPPDGAALVEALDVVARDLTAPASEAGGGVTDIVTKPFRGPRHVGPRHVGDIELHAEPTTTTAPAISGAQRASPRRWPLGLLIGLIVVAAIAWTARRELMPDRGATSSGPPPASAVPPSDGATPGDTMPGAAGDDAPATDDTEAAGSGATGDAGNANPVSTTGEPAATEAPAPPPPPAPAILVVPPAWAPSITVSVDGGTPTPLSTRVERALSPGGHALTFRIDQKGYRREQRVAVEAQPGQRLEVTVPFAPAGRLLVQARPGGLPGVLRIDGEPFGEGRRIPVGFLAPGDHDLEIAPQRELPDARTVTARATVVSGEETIVTFDLQSADPPTIRQRGSSGG